MKSCNLDAKECGVLTFILDQIVSNYILYSCTVSFNFITFLFASIKHVKCTFSKGTQL